MSDLALNEMLALLDALKSTARDFAAREEKLSGEHRAASAAGLKLADEAAVERTAKLAEAMDGENAAFEDRKNRCRSAFENREGAHHPRPRRHPEKTSGRNRRAAQPFEIQDSGRHAGSRAPTRRRAGPNRRDAGEFQERRRANRRIPRWPGKISAARLRRQRKIPAAAIAGTPMAAARPFAGREQIV